MYPTNDVQIVGQTAAAGDAITASVVRSGTSYKLTVTDATHTADSFTKTETCSASSCVDSSAEWIAEAPTGSSGVEPLADFGTWTAANAAVTEGSTAGSVSSFTDDEITMIDSSGATKALPGALNGAGTGFSVTWERASCQRLVPEAARCETTRTRACALCMHGPSDLVAPTGFEPALPP